MGIDYVIDWECVPKTTLLTQGILVRLKAQNRAQAIIKLYRDNGDMRPPAEMGFELERRTPDGSEEVQVVIVQALIDEAAALDPLAPYCVNCPANRAGRPFGCFDAISYPISRAAEVWLLKQLPTPDDALPYLLLRQVIADSPNLGDQVKRMRATDDVFFETSDVFARRVEDLSVSTDQLFEMLFLMNAALPTYAAMLLLFIGAIPRDMDADVLQNLTPAPADWQTRFPFQLRHEADDDATIAAIKDFLASLYVAYGLNVSLSLDA